MIAPAQKLAKRVSRFQDEWISVPTWAKYCRALGFDREFMRSLIRRSWNARR